MGIWNQKASSNGGDFEVAPGGNHPAVLVGIIDLGTQENKFGNEVNMAHQVLLAWELTQEKKKDGSPFIVIRHYTASLNQKAALRNLIKTWRGKDLADGEEFDPRKMLGKPCLLSVINKESGGGNTYAKVEGVTAVPKGMVVGQAVTEPISWAIGEGDYPNPAWMPYLIGKRVADVIQNSPEWKEWRYGPVDPPKGNTVPNAQGQFAEPEPDQAEEAIPF